MKKYILALFILSLGVTIQSCKEDGTDTPTLTNTDLLTQAKWQIQEGTVNPEITVVIPIINDTIVIDEYWDLLALQRNGEVLQCDKDNWMSFGTDSTVTLDEGETKCDPSDPQTEDGGKWHFLDSETKLVMDNSPFDPSGQSQTFTIVALTESQLIIQTTYPFTNPATQQTSNHTIKITFTNIQ